MVELNVIVKWIPFPTAVNILAMMVTFFVVMMKPHACLLMMANKQFGMGPRHTVNQCAIIQRNPKAAHMTAMVTRSDRYVNSLVIVMHLEWMANQVLFAKKINLEKLTGPVREPPVSVSHFYRKCTGNDILRNI